MIKDIKLSKLMEDIKIQQDILDFTANGGKIAFVKPAKPRLSTKSYARNVSKYKRV